MKKIILTALNSLFMTTGQTTTIKLTSNDFIESQELPVNFACDGENISPHLTWENIPKATKSIAIICEDPDAPERTWSHWVIFNIPTTTTHLQQNTPKKALLKNGIRQGVNDASRIGYTGAYPPPGKPHRYFFKIYALDTALNLPAGTTTRENLLSAMKNHTLAQGSLMGTYERK